MGHNVSHILEHRGLDLQDVSGLGNCFLVMLRGPLIYLGFLPVGVKTNNLGQLIDAVHHLPEAHGDGCDNSYVVDRDEKLNISKLKAEGGVKSFINKGKRGRGEGANLFNPPRKSCAKITIALKIGTVYVVDEVWERGGGVSEGPHGHADGCMWCGGESFSDIQNTNILWCVTCL